MEQFFPRGIAKGKAFFNRNEEIKRLTHNINTGMHTLIMSPRRYGKSSLAKRVISQFDHPCAETDLFLIVDEKTIEYKLLKIIRELVQSVSSSPEQWFNALRSYFEGLNKKWTIGISGVSLELKPDNNYPVAENILDAFNALEFILKTKSRKAIIFIDEFQEISGLKESASIEGAIRHFAQETQHVIFVFSGSNRSMLQEMFTDNTRPLYNLCDRIVLNRIQSGFYKEYLNYVSENTWKETINNKLFEKILELTESHPACVYILCSYIWRIYPDKQPDAEQAAECWREYIEDVSKETRNELSNLSLGQLKMLTIIAGGKASGLTGKDVQQSLNFSGSAITQALKSLEDEDFIEKIENNNYRIINPAIKSTLRLFYC